MKRKTVTACEQGYEKQNCANGTRISVPTHRNGKSGIPQFVLENFQSNHAFHLHLNRPSQKFYLNGKRPWTFKGHVTLAKNAKYSGTSSLRSQWSMITKDLGN